MIGAALGGAVTGLAADLMSGGLTLGTGALAGAILGALGGAGVAAGYKEISGKDGSVIRCTGDALTTFFEESLLLYLAVAHFGRGRGEWTRSEHPQHWRAETAKVTALKRAELTVIWAERSDSGEEQWMRDELVVAMDFAMTSILDQFYPDASIRSTKLAYARE